MMRLLLTLSLFLIAFTAAAQTDPPNVYVNNGGDVNIDIRFSSVAFWLETQLDTSKTFIHARSKVTKSSWTDTLQGLKLATRYFLRCRFVGSNGTPVTDWGQVTEYHTCNYPLPLLLAQKTIPAYQNYPVTDFYFGNLSSTTIDFLYDTVPTFNSAAFRNLGYKPGDAGTVYGGFIIPRKRYFLKMRVTSGSEVLNWKTVEVENRFGGEFQIQQFLCSGNTFFMQFLFYNQLNASPLSAKLIIQQQSRTDTFDAAPSFLYRSVPIEDTAGATIIFAYEGKIGNTSISDTVIRKFSNLLFRELPTLTPANSKDSNRFLFGNILCNSTLEYEVYKDSTLGILIEKGSKFMSTNLGYFPATTFNIHDNNFVRYRVSRLGYSSKWQTFDRKKYYPFVGPDDPNRYLKDTTSPIWHFLHSFVYPSASLECEIDINQNFNSPKRKLLVLKDTTQFMMESLFGMYNFVRFRQTDGNYHSNWSPVSYRRFTTGSGKAPTCNSNHGVGTSFQPNTTYFGASDFNFGLQRNALKNVTSSQYVNIDTMPIVMGDSLFVRYRKRTTIDTAAWTTTAACAYNNHSQYCIPPYITYNGYRNNLDTFHLRYLNRSPLITQKFIFVFGPSQSKISGFVKVTGNPMAVHRNQFPNNWMFTLIPDCPDPRAFSPVVPPWYSVSGALLHQMQAKTTKFGYWSSETNIYYFADAGDRTIEICNISGQVLQKVVCNGTTFTTSELPPGYYVLRVIQNQTFSHEFILIR